jgi:aminoglycoside phosphotransferase (APT) family kinase protein
VLPLVDVSRETLAKLVGEPIGRIEPVGGGLTNTIHKVTATSGKIFIVKHHAGGAEPYDDEVATLERLAGILPVPEIVRADREHRAIVYRFIAGITLDECRRQQPPSAFASLAEPLGRFLAWLSSLNPNYSGLATSTWDVRAFIAVALRTLSSGRPRERLGPQMADALRNLIEAAAPQLEWGQPCLSHGDLSSSNLIVQRAMGERWRIAGVIDWEAAACASPLVDIGSLFRSERVDATFLGDFERGYREADGELPEQWHRTARLLDSLWLVETLDEEREMPGVYADCRMLIAKLVADLHQ